MEGFTVQFKFGEPLLGGNSEADVQGHWAAAAAWGASASQTNALLAGAAAPTSQRPLHFTRPLAADTYAKKDQSKGYNALALYDVANCWMRQVRWGAAQHSHGASSGQRRAAGSAPKGVGCPPAALYGNVLPPLAAHAPGFYCRSRS